MSPRCWLTWRATSRRPATPDALSSAPLWTASTPGSRALEPPPMPRWSRCAPTMTAPGSRAPPPARITPITLLVSVRTWSSATASRALWRPLAGRGAALGGAARGLGGDNGDRDLRLALGGGEPGQRRLVLGRIAVVDDDQTD